MGLATAPGVAFIPVPCLDSLPGKIFPSFLTGLRTLLSLRRDESSRFRGPGDDGGSYIFDLVSRSAACEEADEVGSLLSLFCGGGTWITQKRSLRNGRGRPIPAVWSVKGLEDSDNLAECVFCSILKNRRELPRDLQRKMT